MASQKPCLESQSILYESIILTCVSPDVHIALDIAIGQAVNCKTGNTPPCYIQKISEDMKNCCHVEALNE